MTAEPRFKREPVRSRALLDSARGQPCTLQFACCNHDPATTVSCHLHDETFGMALKADDFATVHGCSACHMFLDHGWVGQIPLHELLDHVIRALLRTFRNRLDRGLIQIPRDAAPKPRATAPRKPPEQRAKVPGGRPLQSRTDWPEGRKLPRKLRQKEPT